uniref:DNA repair protein RAD51 homolog 4-like n=1 Tax=Sinocyclocheilus anshuiensis TaxID=1608454 RepID=A0A671QNR5_9TELE
MVILREGICPGINEEFIKALQSEDIKTGVDNDHQIATCSFSSFHLYSTSFFPFSFMYPYNYNHKVMEALQKIKVFRVFDVFSLLACLQHLRSNSLQKVSIVIFKKRGYLFTILHNTHHNLKMIAKDFNIAVLVTNHVTKDGNGHLKAGLGQSWSHVPRTRVLLQRVEDAETSSLRTATLTKSSRQACHLVEEFDLCHWSEERRTSISDKRKLEERSKP